MLVLACAQGVPPVVRAAEGPAIRLDIPAQPLESALETLALVSGHQLLVWSELLEGKRTERLNGRYAVEEALSRLLADQGLEFEVSRGAILVLPHRSERATPAPPPVRPDPPASTVVQAVQTYIAEVIVTARRREESLQEVPVSVTALTRSDLAERGTANVLGVNGQAANVAIHSSPFSGLAGSTFRMRGIPDVVLYQDGVRSSGGALPSTVDIERIELLRGPQGTLFGRNAVGGAIQIVTRRPSRVLSSDFNVTVGSFDRIDASGSVNLPLGDRVSLRASAATLNRDGFVRSLATGGVLGSQEDRMVRGDLLWEPRPGTEVRLQYARNENASSGQPNVNFRLDAVCPGDPVPDGWRNGQGVQIFGAPNAYCILSRVDLDPQTPGVEAWSDEFHSWGAREAYLNTVRHEDMRWWQTIDDVKLEVSSRLAPALTTRLLASRRWGSQNSTEDLDATGLDLFQNDVNEIKDRFDLRTAELQVVYAGARLSGTTGVYWEESPGTFGKRISWVHNELTLPEVAAAAEAAYPGSTDLRIRPESAPFNTAEVFRIQRTSTRQVAAFAEWTLAVDEALSLTAGLRYTRETGRQIRYARGAEGAVNMPPIRCCELEAGVDYFLPRGESTTVPLPEFEAWTPRLSVQYRWTPDIMGYATYSEGSTAGGINVNLPPGQDPFTYGPQEVRNHELGLRMDLFERHLRLNVSAFYNRVDDIQVSEEAFPGSPTTANAQAEVSGVELEGAWLPNDRLRLDYSLGWLDARYTDTGTTFNITPDSPFAYAPEFTAATGIQYRWNLGALGSLTLRGDYTWQDRTVTAADPLMSGDVPAIGLAGARLAFAPQQGSWSVALSGSNLTNRYYFTSGFLLPADQSFSGTLGRPREWSLSFNLRL